MQRRESKNTDKQKATKNQDDTEADEPAAKKLKDVYGSFFFFFFSNWILILRCYKGEVVQEQESFTWS